jgi:dolichol-phosphate mannosyltransferase
MNARVWVVIPTYNEAENVGPITRAVTDELAKLIPGDHRVLIVDDSSPDGTGRIADNLATELDVVEVLHREHKDGLGKAYVDGFRHALECGAELVVQMDADFSHDPKYLATLIAGAEMHDIVLGSRYVPGGGVRRWGPLRRIISWGGSSYARIVLGLGIRDLTGGYKCVRREVLEHVDLRTLEADGYAFQIEVTYRALQCGFKVTEIPIVFVDRAAGSSKMSWRIAAEAMLLVPRMRRAPMGGVSATRR